MKPSGIRQQLDRAEGTLSKVGLICACVALFVSMVIVVIGVVGRYVLNVAIVFVDEYTGYALVIMAFMGLAHTLSVERHIKVDAATRLLPQKAQDWLEVGTSILALGITLFVTLQTWKRAYVSYETHTVSVSPLETPLFIPQLFIPVGFLLLDFGFIVYIWKKVEKALAAEARSE